MLATFEKLVSDKNRSFTAEFSNNSDIMLITFGGIMGELGLPAFEFFNSTSGFPVKKIYLRDLNQSWYHKGLDGIGNNIDEIAEFLTEKKNQYNVRKIIVIGNSMGGYAALLFGWLIEADIVHSFSPQTFIGRLPRLLNLDFRWSHQINNVYKIKDIETHYLDLKRLFSSKRNKKTHFYIHYSINDRLDRIHANRMKIIQNVELIEYKCGEHNIIKLLRDDRTLNNLLTNCLTD